MTEDEYHVASYVVSARPEHAAAVTEQIMCLPGVEVHAQDKGKLVVTAEASNTRELAEIAARLEEIDAVIAVAPVYHEYDCSN